jgi:hypothetical protein
MAEAVGIGVGQQVYFSLTEQMAIPGGMGSSSSVHGTGQVDTYDAHLTAKKVKNLLKVHSQYVRKKRVKERESSPYPVEEQRAVPSVNMRAIAGDVVYAMGKDLVKSFGNALFSTGPKDKPDDDLDEEDLGPLSGVHAYTHAFARSQHKRFKNKSRAERARIARGAYYHNKRKDK